jgi:hypothetical protein
MENMNNNKETIVENYPSLKTDTTYRKELWYFDTQAKAWGMSVRARWNLTEYSVEYRVMVNGGIYCKKHYLHDDEPNADMTPYHLQMLLTIDNLTCVGKMEEIKPMADKQLMYVHACTDEDVTKRVIGNNVKLKGTTYTKILAPIMKKLQLQYYVSLMKRGFDNTPFVMAKALGNEHNGNFPPHHMYEMGQYAMEDFKAGGTRAALMVATAKCMHSMYPVRSDRNMYNETGLTYTEALHQLRGRIPKYILKHGFSTATILKADIGYQEWTLPDQDYWNKPAGWNQACTLMKNTWITAAFTGGRTRGVFGRSAMVTHKFLSTLMQMNMDELKKMAKLVREEGLPDFAIRGYEFWGDLFTWLSDGYRILHDMRMNRDEYYIRERIQLMTLDNEGHLYDKAVRVFSAHFEQRYPTREYTGSLMKRIAQCGMNHRSQAAYYRDRGNSQGDDHVQMWGLDNEKLMDLIPEEYKSDIIRTKGDMRAAGKQYHHCIGTYANSTGSIFFNKGTTCAQMSMKGDKPVMIQCFAPHDRKTTVSKKYGESMSRSIKGRTSRVLKKAGMKSMKEYLGTVSYDDQALGF